MLSATPGGICCSGAREAALKIADAMVAAYVELISDKLPSTVKFYTMEQSIRAETGLHMQGLDNIITNTQFVQLLRGLILQHVHLVMLSDDVEESPHPSPRHNK